MYFFDAWLALKNLGLGLDNQRQTPYLRLNIMGGVSMSRNIGLWAVSLLLLGAFISPDCVAKKLKVGLVLDKAGRDDKSFNAAAYKGASEARRKLGIHLKVVTATDDAAIEPSLRTFAQRKFDLVIGIGFAHGAPMKKVASEFKSSKFLVVDAAIDRPNVRSVLFNEHEGSFLVGAIAALTTKTNAVGFIGGMDIPLIRRFEYGYRAGVEAVNPKAKVIVNYVGTTPNAWHNPMKGKELALAQYSKKIDIIFSPAGASNLGVFDAAEEKRRLAIGVDSNQNWIKPGRILTSMIKRVDMAVYDAIESVLKNEFQSGTFYMGIAEGGVGFSVDEHNRSILTPEVEKKANEFKRKILNKEITVPDYYKIHNSVKS